MIIIPFTHYEFRPPPGIIQTEFESLKNINRVELTQLLAATGERERRAFIEAHPVQHALTRFTFLILVASLVCGLLLLALYATGRGDAVVSATWGAVLSYFAALFFSRLSSFGATQRHTLPSENFLQRADGFISS